MWAYYTTCNLFHTLYGPSLLHTELFKYSMASTVKWCLCLPCCRMLHRDAYSHLPQARCFESCRKYAGYNRSGFCISSYCIEKCGLSVSAALDSFAYSREGGIHHDKFIQELVHRYAHVQAPIQSFDPHTYSSFYSGSARAAQLRLRESWKAAGESEGEWMLSQATGRRLVPKTPHSRCSIASDDSHNDIDTLLIVSDASESTES
jgi:hypothetical protein